MRRWMALALVIASLAFAASACSTPSVPAPPVTPVTKEIRIGRPYDATTFDPASANDDGSYDILRQMGEGLVRLVGGEILPGIAENWDVSANGVEYTFHLRESMWSDGTPLTAKDFEYSFLRIVDPASAFNNAGDALIFKNAKKYMDGQCSVEEVGVKATDDNTLKITLESASLETLNRLSSYVFFPVSRTLVEKFAEAYGAEAANVLTNGPFTLTEWAHEAKLVLEKNENYWNAEDIKLTKITGIVGATAETAVDMMQAGELDFTYTTDYAQMETLQGSGFTATPYSSGYQFVLMNSEGGSEESGRFMANTNFRKALNLAISREAIVTSIFTGAAAATRISAPDTSGAEGLFVEEYPLEAWPPTGDPVQAKRLLDLALNELNAKIEDVPVLSMLCFESQRSMMVLQAVQDMILNALGVQCKIDSQPIQQMLAKAFSGDWDMWWGGRTLGSLDWASSDGWGTSYDYRLPDYIQGWVNEDYVVLIDQLDSAKTLKERKDIVFEMEKILCDDPPAILIGWTQTFACYVKELTGVIVLDGYSNLNYADLAK